MRRSFLLLFTLLGMVAAPLLAQENPALQGGEYTEGEVTARKKSELPPLSYIVREEFPAGVQHIMTGTDHISFVLALALIMLSGWHLFRVVTFFTIAHAATLTISSLNLIPLGAMGIAVIELGVAASIAWVGIENIYFQRKQKEMPINRRSALAFGFGLVHGLAFSEHFRQSMLSVDLSIGANLGKFLLKILFFNLGVDAGQLFWVYLAFVGLVLVRKHAIEGVAEKITLYGSACIGLLGAGWVFERLMKIGSMV